MNPASFQGLGMGPMGMHVGQPQMGMNQPQMLQQPMLQMNQQPQMVNPTSQQQQILQYLRTQKVLPGWQQTCRIELRMTFIHQIITQLSLLRTEAPMQPATIAIEFERKEFESSPDQMTYEGKCREKLQQLTNARQGRQQRQQIQNPQNAQMGFVQPPMGGNAMFAAQQQFQQSQAFPQGQQPVQNPSLAMQQQQQAQQLARMQMRNGTGEQPAFVNGQSGPNPPRQTPHGANSQFTQQDQQQIQQLAQNMVNNMTPQGRHGLQQAVASMQPQLKQSLTERGTDLHHYVIRQQATQIFLQQRTRMAAQAGNQGGPFPGAGIVPQGPSNGQAPTSMQIQQTPQFDQPGSMDHIVRQQQEGIHHQQEGQVVVPANTGQRAGNQQRAPSRVQKTPQQNQPAAFAASRPMQTPIQNPPQPQSNWNQVPKQTPKSQHQTPQITQAQNFAQMQSQASQQNALQGQTGGLNNALRTPQQNARMPTLTQSMNPPSQPQKVSSPNPVQQTPNPGQPNPGQRTAQNPSNMLQRATPNGQQHSTPGTNVPQRGAMPLAMQQYIASLKTDEEKKNFVMTLRKRQMLQQQQSSNNNSMTPQLSQGKRPVPQAGPQKQTSASQTTPATGTQAMSNQPHMNAPQAPSMARPNQGTQQPDAPNNSRSSQPTLTEMQEQQMDSVSYPDNILNSSSVLARMPGHVKNWGQLKQWVDNNAQTLPPDSLQKVKMLQARHYHMGMQNPRRLMANQAQPSNMLQQPLGTGPAPSAPMFPNGNAQQPLQQGQQLGQTKQMPFSQLQTPTMQEVQRFKASLPNPNLMSDEQIQSTLMSKKRQDILAAQQNSQTQAAKSQQLMQEQYAAMIRNQQLQQNREHGLQNGQMPQQQQLGQTPGPSKGPQWVAQQARLQATQLRQSQLNQSNQAGSKPQQGVKRSNNDDVVEVPDPKLAPHQSRATPVSMETQPSAPPSQPRLIVEQAAAYNRLTPAQIASLNPAQRAAFENQRQQAGQRVMKPVQGQTNLPTQVPAHLNIGNNGNSNDPKAIRIRQLREEVMRNMPPRKIVPMSALERGNMVKKLGEVKGLFNRIDASLPVFLVATQNENRVKDIIRTQLLLAFQVRDTDHNPVDGFTISSEEFRNHLNNMQRYMTEVSHIVQQLQQKANLNNQGQQSQAAKPPAQAVPHTQQLSAANLQQQQEILNRTRTASLNKSQGTNKTPAAPTTSHVPFPFRSQSPQGVPQIYVPKKNELTRDKLQLPVPKKRRTLASDTGATQAATMSPNKSSGSPEAQRLPPQMAIKCTVPDCKNAAFASKELLEKHTKDVHEVKDEQITDPVEYVLGGLRMALNLDENGHSKQVDTKSAAEIHSSPAMKTSASSQGAKAIKQEVATPVSKSLSLTGLKTPQMKASMPTPVRESGQPISAIPTKDPWASTNVSQHWFEEVFRDVADPNRPLSGGFLATWLEAQPHPDISSDDSPQSTDKNSPRKSDISATDNLDIAIIGPDGVLTDNWFDVTGDLEALDMAGFVNMDWDPTFAAEPTASLGKKASGEPSDEWLKVFAPNKYAEKMKTNKRAVR